MQLLNIDWPKGISTALKREPWQYDKIHRKMLTPKNDEIC